MKKLLMAVLLLVVACRTSDSPELTCAESNDGLTLPEGFCAIVVADSLGRARHLAVSENGDVYVALRQVAERGGIAALRDLDGDGRADSIAYFGELGGTGIHLQNGWLYFGADTLIVRYALQEGALLPEGDAETIVRGFHDQPSHATKPFDFDGAGSMYLNIGAPSNACQSPSRMPGVAGQDPCPLLEEYAGIWRVAAETPNQTVYGDGMRYATGIRNAVALTWHAAHNRLYVVQHGRDDLHRLWQDRFTVEQNNQLPAEEFFVVEEGDDFGWPYCYYDHLKGQKVLGPEYGGDGELADRCSETKDPIYGFTAHWAPNDVIFYTGTQYPERYQGGALVAFHGSWNREPLQAGFQVSFLPLGDEGVAGDAEVFAGGFAGTDSLSTPGRAKARPTGLAQGPDGSVYISDSVRGRIWRIIYTGS